MKQRYYYKKIQTILLTVICVLTVVLQSSCTNKKNSEDRIDVRSIYEGKPLVGSFIMRVFLTDVPKSVFTNAIIDGSFNITYESGVYSCVLESLHVKVDSTDASVDYDSANTYNDEKVLARIAPYKAFLGVNFKATVDSTGKISALSGYEKVDNNIKNELIKYGQNTVDQASFAAREYLDESILKMLLSFYIGYIPEKGLLPNDSWSYNLKYKAPYLVNNELFCSLTEKKDNKLVISTIGTLNTAVDEKNYTGLEYALTGTSDSKIYITEGSKTIKNGTYIENITGYCYYDINGSDIRDTLTLTRNVTFTLDVRE